MPAEIWEMFPSMHTQQRGGPALLPRGQSSTMVDFSEAWPEGIPQILAKEHIPACASRRWQWSASRAKAALVH